VAQLTAQGTGVPRSDLASIDGGLQMSRPHVGHHGAELFSCRVEVTGDIGQRIRFGASSSIVHLYSLDMGLT
jgi:hypothetical protein